MRNNLAKKFPEMSSYHCSRDIHIAELIAFNYIYEISRSIMQIISYPTRFCWGHCQYILKILLKKKRFINYNSGMNSGKENILNLIIRFLNKWS